MTTTEQAHKAPGWSPGRPKFRPLALVVAWLVSASALLVAAWIVPGAAVNGFLGALAAAVAIAALNAVVPPILAALRLPLMVLTGLVLILIADALMLLAADRITDHDLQIDSFWSALGVAFVTAAVTVVLDIVLGTNDDDTYTIRVIQRIARRSGGRTVTDAPGIVFLEIDGLALPVLQRATRDGSAPNMARWLAEGDYRFAEWETDLSSQTGASQAGILLGSNDDIPAFRWVEKETAKLVACSGPPDCAEIERRHATGQGLLVDGGASRGNLLSGEADHMILTVSRMDAEKRANPGYRAFFANGFNVVTRSGAVLLGGRARVVGRRESQTPRCSAARPPGRPLPVHARRALRRRPRPDRVRRALRHDERAARDLRHLLELRRGGAPLGPGARRHPRGPAQARPAVRADRAGQGVRGPSLRDRRALRPRADAGGDLQAAERLRPRRARRALARERQRWRPSPVETRTTATSATPSAKRPAARRRRSARRTTSPTRRWSSSAPATSA